MATKRKADRVLPCCCSIKLRFNSEAHAQIAVDTLCVDEELQATSGKVARFLTASGEVVTATFEAVDARTLRLCVSGFVDMASLVVATLSEFGSA
mmetsp:Transcript_6600/g.15140  ORF Transcript_6600/g.15140 Transcript_6600/m.15140 type:complete len:95 (+) Transcript_6600:264-548(+)